MAEFYNDFWACIDANQAIADLDRVEGKRKETEGNLEKTDKHSQATFMKARQVAMKSWNILTSVLEMAGVQVSAVARAVFMGITNVGTMLYQLAAAEAITPGLQWKAAITFGLAGVAILQAIASQNKLEQEKQSIETVENIFRLGNSIIGGGMYW